MARIATVGYLNAAPLVVGLDARFEVVRDHPAAIAELLRTGQVDVALVPVASVLRDPALKVVPGWCIGAEGPVTSVLLVAETPSERWTRIVLDGESRSSAALVRLLVDGPLGLDVEIEDGDPGTGVDRARGTVASLVIGDTARALPDRLTTRIDLAGAWTNWTGLPFVFAVWAGRPGLDPSVVRAVREAGRVGLSRLEQDHAGADLTYLRDRLRYPLDDRALMGLRRFAALGRRAGLFPESDVVLFGPATTRLDRPSVDALLARAAAGEWLESTELDLLATAPLADLATAAVLRAADMGEVGYRLADAGAVPEVAPGPGLVDALGSVRTAAAVRVGPGGTATEVLRAVALTRLAVPEGVHVVVPWTAHGEAITQAALHGGADDVGAIDASAVAEVERLVREARFRPVRRNDAFEVVGGALTEPSHRRPLPA